MDNAAGVAYSRPMSGRRTRVYAASPARVSARLLAALLAVLALLAFAVARTATASPSDPATQAAAQATQWWQANGVKLMTVFRNGQCTDWVSRKRPDVVERVEEASLVAKLLHRPFPKVDFTAKNWAKLAELGGLKVGTTPTVGAIAVWQPGVEGAKKTGHVGYVESVAGGSFTVSEENFGKAYVVGKRTLPAAPLAGRLFIYR